MIKYSFTIKSNKWSARLNKVKLLVEKILELKKLLRFNSNIDYECNIILADDILMKKINFKYRKKNKTTDVLTFISEIKLKNVKNQKFCDIFLSADTLKKDSIKNNISFYNHLSHILIHSFLHINGYDHKKINDFKNMKKTEILILFKMGIKNPYLAI